MAALTCKVCGESLERDKNFYKNSKTNAHLEVCKSCLKSYVNPDKTRTFMWILKALDIPYLSTVWNDLVKRYEDQKNSIISRYIAKMHLATYNVYGFNDTRKFINQEAEQGEQDFIEIQKSLKGVILKNDDLIPRLEQ